MRRTLATLFAALLACGAVTVAVASGHLARDRANGARLAVPARPATDPAPEPSGLQAVSPTGAALAEMNRRLGTPAQVARSARKRARQIARIEARLRKLAAIARADAARRAAAEAEAARLRLGMTGYSTPVGSGPAWSDPAAAAVPDRAPDSQAESQWLASGRGGWVEASGFARAPANAPPAIKRVIQAGNLIARSPYLWGGGHGQWQDQGYDCSGSVSYALATGGMLGSSLTSGQLMNWGVPGPGRWLTLYANGHHVFMVVAGLRFDTSGRAGDHASRWQLAPRSTDGFAVRHYPGL